MLFSALLGKDSLRASTNRVKEDEDASTLVFSCLDTDRDYLSFALESLLLFCLKIFKSITRTLAFYQRI